MLFFAMTRPRRKMGMLLTVTVVALALFVVIPALYSLMTDANSLERFASKEQYPGEPIRVDAPAVDLEDLAVWKEIQTIYKIEQSGK